MEGGGLFPNSGKKNTEKGIKKNPEKVSFKEEFNAFVQKIGTLTPDDTDIIAGKEREYLAFPKLYSSYVETFKSESLRETSLNYRLRQIKEGEFQDDFVVINDQVSKYEPKYFINRLNTKLLEKIFLPVIKKDAKEAANEAKLFEQDAQAMREFNSDFDDDDDDF